MTSLSNERQRQIENELRKLERQVEAMDGKLRAYLADRQNKPHPRHDELIEKIQQYRIPGGASSKQLENILDNLQWKVYYHKRAWQQLWENAEAAYRQGRALTNDHASEAAETEEKDAESRQSSSSLHNYWSMQRNKLQEMGEVSRESADEFEARIKQRYRQLAESKGEDQEIIMTFSKEKRQCTLELRRKN